MSIRDRLGLSLGLLALSFGGLFLDGKLLDPLLEVVCCSTDCIFVARWRVHFRFLLGSLGVSELLLEFRDVLRSFVASLLGSILLALHGLSTNNNTQLM